MKKKIVCLKDVEIYTQRGVFRKILLEKGAYLYHESGDIYHLDDTFIGWVQPSIRWWLQSLSKYRENKINEILDDEI